MLKKIFIITIIILSFASFALAGGAIFVNNKINSSFGENSAEKNFVIKKGQGVNEIASALEKEELIENALYFKIYAIQKNLAESLQAGEYLLSSNLTISKIAEKFSKGEIISRDKKITVIEGWNNNQIAEYLEKEGICKKSYFISKANCEYGVNTRRDFLNGKPKGASLEGFLFPDTYFVREGASESQIINKMLDNFGKKLTDEMKEEIKNQNKTVFEIVILASIIEKEVRSGEDMAKVAGIFYNRLSDEFPLQSCATIGYVLGVNKKQYSYEDTRVSSPYNTYTNKGLPPGPISNPGISSIKAAIWPQFMEYYYFLSKENGETVFSKTIDEHNENKVRWLK